MASEASFGKEFLSSHFLLDPEWTFVNHGAFGAPLSETYELADRWRRHAELQPLRFIDRLLFPHVVQVDYSNLKAFPQKRIDSIKFCQFNLLYRFFLCYHLLEVF
jgi:hypothetical protein